jgi:hypothetical protein
VTPTIDTYGKLIFNTPIKIGTMQRGNKISGDAGYAIEESLSGGRIFHEKDINQFSID